MKFWTKQPEKWTGGETIEFLAASYAICFAFYAAIENSAAICDWAKTKIKRFIPTKTNPEDSEP